MVSGYARRVGAQVTLPGLSHPNYLSPQPGPSSEAGGCRFSASACGPAIQCLAPGNGQMWQEAWLIRLLEEWASGTLTEARFTQICQAGSGTLVPLSQEVGGVIPQTNACLRDLPCLPPTAGIPSIATSHFGIPLMPESSLPHQAIVSFLQHGLKTTPTYQTSKLRSTHSRPTPATATFSQHSLSAHKPTCVHRSLCVFHPVSTKRRGNWTATALYSQRTGPGV